MAKSKYETDLDDPIAEVLLSRETPSWHRPTVGRYHASQLPYCLRKQWYSFQMIDDTEEESYEDVTGLRSLWMGSTFHEQMSDFILPRVVDAFQLIDAERPLYYVVDAGNEDIMIVGRYDGLIKLPDGRISVLEIKTTKTLEYLERDMIPQEHHLLQASFYMKAMNADMVTFLYWGWKEMRPLFLQAPFKSIHFNRVRDAARDLHYSLIMNEAPDPSPNFSWECRFCKYKNVCPKGSE